MAKRREKYTRLLIRLKSKERRQLERLTSGGTESVRVFKRAQILLLLDDGASTGEVAKAARVHVDTVRNTGWKYVEEGLELSLGEKPRSGQPPALNEQQAQRIVALACSSPPKGCARWSVRLLADEAKRRGIVNGVGRETIRILLKNHDLKPWREKNVVRRTA